MPAHRPHDAPNRWAKQMDRDESWVSAVAMWAFYVVGATLLIASTFGLLVSIVFLFEPPDETMGARLGAGAGLLVSLVGFWTGHRLSDAYAVKSKRGNR